MQGEQLLQSQRETCELQATLADLARAQNLSSTQPLVEVCKLRKQQMAAQQHSEELER